MKRVGIGLRAPEKNAWQTFGVLILGRGGVNAGDGESRAGCATAEHGKRSECIPIEAPCHEAAERAGIIWMLPLDLKGYVIRIDEVILLARTRG